MAIIGLKDRETLLKSLRFGNDVKGGGDSGQPFIKSDLGDEGGVGSDFINGLTKNSYGDFPVRGSTAAIIKTAEDAIRIGKFTTTFPQGLLFIQKQIGLNASNPLIQTGEQGSLRNTQQYNVGNLLRQVAVQGSGVHLPQAGIGVNELLNPRNKYAYIVSHEEKDENRLLNLKYITDSTILNQEDHNSFSTSPTAQNSRKFLGLADGANSRSGLMFNYFGGPGSVYGLGNTLISYSTTNNGAPLNTFSSPKFIGPYKNEDNTQGTPDIYRNNPTFKRKYDVLRANGLDLQTIINPLAESNPINIKEVSLKTNANILVQDAPKYIGSFVTSGGKQGVPLIDSRVAISNYIGWNNQIVDIKKAIAAAEKKELQKIPIYNEPFSIVQQGNLGRASIIPSSSKSPWVDNEQTVTGDINYDGKLDVTRRQGFNRNFFSNAMTYDSLVSQTPKRPSPNLEGNIPVAITPGSDYSTRKLKGNLSNTDYYAIENRIKAPGVGKSDGINMMSLYSDTSNPFVDQTSVYKNSARDLIKFGFEAICNDCPDTTKVHFRSYITAFADNHTAQWEGTKYAGRGENFYTYQGHDRSVNVSFLIAATSKDEMKPLWQKLNFLVSTLYSDYSRDGYMRGNLIRFTLGEYFYRTPGILTNIDINIENEYPWEIKMRSTEGVSGDKQMELPMICSISFGFIPILDKLPERGTKTPLVITDKTTGIQSYLNDKNLVEECLPQKVSQPEEEEPETPPSTEPTGSVSDLVLSAFQPPEIVQDTTDKNQYVKDISKILNNNTNPLDRSDLEKKFSEWNNSQQNDPDLLENINNQIETETINNQEVPITRTYFIDGVEVNKAAFDVYNEAQTTLKINEKMRQRARDNFGKSGGYRN